jgi:hypothetical protein
MKVSSSYLLQSRAKGTPLGLSVSTNEKFVSTTIGFILQQSVFQTLHFALAFAVQKSLLFWKGDLGVSFTS